MSQIIEKMRPRIKKQLAMYASTRAPQELYQLTCDFAKTNEIPVAWDRKDVANYVMRFERTPLALQAQELVDQCHALQASSELFRFKVDFDNDRTLTTCKLFNSGTYSAFFTNSACIAATLPPVSCATYGAFAISAANNCSVLITTSWVLSFTIVAIAELDEFLKNDKQGTKRRTELENKLESARAAPSSA